jgi:hypothetical protein
MNKAGLGLQVLATLVQLGILAENIIIKTIIIILN